MPRAALLALLLPAVCFAQDAIQPRLANLRIGDSLKDIQRIYVPSQKWWSHKAIRGGTNVDRFTVRRGDLKKPDMRVDTFVMDLHGGRLVDLQLIYDMNYTRAMSVDKLATEYSMIYGEPQRSADGAYFWNDGSYTLRVFYAEVPVLEGRDTSVELRTSVQLSEIAG